MDHVTRATPLLGMVGRPKANTWYSVQAHKIYEASFSRSRDISGVCNFKMRHVALTTPI